MYTYSTKTGEINNVDINIRNQFSGLKKEFGIDVLYIRNNKFVRCTCFNDTEKTGDPRCKKCFGSGYFASVQKFNTMESSSSPYSGRIQSTPIGAVDSKEEIYYFDYTVVPKERDFILKVSWKNNKPVDVIRVLEITNVYEMRGNNGRIETFGTGVKNRPDVVKQFNNMLKMFPVKALTVLEKGGKYIWPMKLLTSINENN